MEFGTYGGQLIPPSIMKAVKEVEHAYAKVRNDPTFLEEFHFYLREYANRPSLLYYCKNITEDLQGAKVYLKREDLNHTGAHKINNVLGQALLARRMGKTKLIAETGAGQHGVATATDQEAIDAFLYLSKREGIIPAIESSHAVAEALKRAKTMRKDQIIVVNLSGRGDKDVKHIARILGKKLQD